MTGGKEFKTKEDETITVKFAADQVEEIIPDALMMFSLVTLKNGEKHFVRGTVQEIRDKLNGND
jgi:hypothetical protein